MKPTNDFIYHAMWIPFVVYWFLTCGVLIPLFAILNAIFYIPSAGHSGRLFTLIVDKIVSPLNRMDDFAIKNLYSNNKGVK